MSYIEKKPALIKNAIADQIKTAACGLTISEWNSVVNILKAQTNCNTDTLAKFYQVIFGAYDANTSGFYQFTDEDKGIVPYLLDYLESNKNALDAHVNSKGNPHAVTKAQVGLSEVDNTADANKPMTQEVADALATKEDTTMVDSKLATAKVVSDKALADESIVLKDLVESSHKDLDDSKVEIEVNNTENKVAYVIDTNQVQHTVELSTSNDPDTIPVRDNMGFTKVLDPTDPDHTSNKRYTDAGLTAHDNNALSHLAIRQLIENLNKEIARLDGRGRSYGSLDYLHSELLALSIADRDAAILLTLTTNFPEYALSKGDLVYTKESKDENTHEWEYNEERWIDNGAWSIEKASNSNYGIVKGGNKYVNVVEGLIEVLSADFAERIGTDTNNFNYESLVAKFAGKYEKAEVDQLIIDTQAYVDNLKEFNGWENTLVSGSPFSPGNLIPKTLISTYDIVKIFVVDAEGTVDTDSFETNIGLVDGYTFKFFEHTDLDVHLTIGTVCTFTAPEGYKLSINGLTYTEANAAMPNKANVFTLPQTVPYGTEDGHTANIQQIKEFIANSGSYLVYEKVDDFPFPGGEGLLYLAKLTNAGDEIEPDWIDYNMLYRWDTDTSDYVAIAGQGTGGSGTGTAVNTATVSLKPEPIDSSLSFAHVVGDELKYSINYQHDENPIGTLKIFRNSVLLDTYGVTTGVIEVDLTNYIRSGYNGIVIKISDGVYSKSLSLNVSGAAINISTTFDDSIAYGANVNIPFRVESETDRKVYFTLNGVTETFNITTADALKQLAWLDHGVNEVSIKASVTVNDTEVFSDTIYINVITVIDDTPKLLSSKFNAVEVEQGRLLNIDYVVYDPLLEVSDVSLEVDDVVVSELSIGRTRQYWKLRDLSIGERKLSIVSGTVRKDFNVLVTALDIEFTNNESFLATYFKTTGRTNQDLNREVWSSSFGDPLEIELKDFNYASNGWIDDALVFNGNAKATIPYKVFSTEIEQVGRTVEIEFETAESAYNENFIECFDNGIGFYIKKDRAVFTSSNTNTSVFFKENDPIKLSFVVYPKPFVTTDNVLESNAFIYINGVLSGMDHVDYETSFLQDNPQDISVNQHLSCGKLYNFRVYERALGHQEILSNYLYDLIDIDTKIEYSYASDIFNSNGSAVYDKVKTRIPVMTIKTNDGESLPNDKSTRTTVSVFFEDYTDSDNNFSIMSCTLRTQGTSTLKYPVKNFRLYSGDLDTNPITLDNNTHPACRINLKADYMESSMATDGKLPALFEQSLVAETPIKARDGKSRSTIWSRGAIALFHDNGTTTRFEGLYNFNTDKGDGKLWGFYEEEGETVETTVKRRYEILYNAADDAVAFIRKPGMTDNEFLLEIARGYECRYPYDEDDVAEMVEFDDYEGLNKAYGDLAEFIEFISAAEIVTQEGQAAFKEEFIARTEPEYFLKFFVTIIMFGLVDSFGKDLMPSSWSKVEYNGEMVSKWYLQLYDLDSAIGIDNFGRMVNADGDLVYDYNIELDKGGVYAQATSKLWESLMVCFDDEIKETYNELRSGSYSFESVWNAMYTNQIRMIGKGLYNANAIAKYIKTDASGYYHMLNGDRMEQMKRWITNRYAFLDSKYDYETGATSIIARIDSEDISKVKFIVKASKHQWITMQLGHGAGTAGYAKELFDLNRVMDISNVTKDTTDISLFDTSADDYNEKITQYYENIKQYNILSKLTEAELAEYFSEESFVVLDNEYTEGSAVTFMEWDLKNGQYITELVNIKDITLQNLKLEHAESLRKLDLSKTAADTTLTDLSFGVIPELSEVNLYNNMGLTGTLDLSSAIKLRKLDIRNTSYSSVTFPEGGVLEEVYLPKTIKTLEIKNQDTLSVVNLASYTKLDKFILESIPLDFRNFLPYLATDAAVRMTGIKISAYGSSFVTYLKSYLTGRKGINEYGDIVDNPSLQGVIKIISSAILPSSYTEWLDTNIPEELEININYNLGTTTYIESDGACTLSVFDPTITGDVVIPESIRTDLSASNDIVFNIDNWYPVKHVATRAFANSLLSNILLPAYIESIGDYAFINAINLETVVLESSITTLGERIFHNIPDTLKVYVGYPERPGGWSTDWNFYEHTVFWNLRPDKSRFIFDCLDGTSPRIYKATILIEQPIVPTLYGYLFKGWTLNGDLISFPYMPTGDDPYDYIFEAKWEAWRYTTMFLNADGTLYITLESVYGSPINLPEGTPTSGTLDFFGWKTSTNVSVYEDYTITSEIDDVTVNNAATLLVFNATFLDSIGLVYEYDVTADVYDISNLLTEGRSGNGTVNLFVPPTYDDGTHGVRAVRNVLLDQATGGNLLKNVEVAASGVPNRSFKVYNAYCVETIVFPDEITVAPDNFVGRCRQLKHFNVPSTITEFGNSVFSGCSKLEELVLPDGLLKIGYNFASSCTVIKEIILPETLISIGSSAFEACYGLTTMHIPSGCTDIGDGLFKSCKNIVSIDMPLVVDPRSMFYYCLSLTSYTLPEGTKSLYETFNYCTALESVVLSSTVTSLSSTTFYNCGALKEVIIPSKVTYIGRGVFSNSGIEHIVIPDSVTSISGGYPGNYGSYTDGAFTNATKLISVVLSENIKTITQGVFKNCYLLETINIPDKVTKIETRAFLSCRSLKALVLSPNLTTIQDGAFACCDSLETITIPSKVTSMGTGVFSSCDLLEAIIIKSAVPFTITDTTFDGLIDTATIYVPEGSLAIYSLSTNWASYADRMEEYTGGE